MSNRPIYTLEEDFQRLGLIGEMGDRMPSQGGGSQMRPEVFKKREADVLKNIKAQKKLDLAKKKLGAPDMQTSDTDHDGDPLHEVSRQKVRRAKGVQKMLQHQQDVQNYRQTKGTVLRKQRMYRRSGKGKRHAAILAKAPKGGRNYRRQVESTGLANLGGIVTALSEPFNTANLQQVYSNIRRLGRATSEGFSDMLGEGYVSTKFDFSTFGEAAIGVANEAAIYANALAEHEGHISVSDQDLLQEHAEKLAAELSKMVSVLGGARNVIDVAEGYDPGDDDDDADYEDDGDGDGDGDGDDDLGEQTYGEAPMPMIHGYGNDPDATVFSVMNPLGITKVGHREKLILAKQLQRERTETEDEDIDGEDLGEHYWELP